jgi:hypothetical protein
MMHDDMHEVLLFQEIMSSVPTRDRRIHDERRRPDRIMPGHAEVKHAGIVTLFLNLAMRVSARVAQTQCRAYGYTE